MEWIDKQYGYTILPARYKTSNINKAGGGGKKKKKSNKKKT